MDSDRKLELLVSETEDLLDQVEGENSPELTVVRSRLEKSLKRTKALLADQQNSSSPLKIRHVAGSVNDYVRNYPWLALATGILVASTLGILATSATRRSYSQDH